MKHDTSSLLTTLNPAQRQAAQHLEGPLLVVAGAGAGKTRVLTFRIMNLIAHGTAPHAILAITFTNKAAKEMRERVHSLLRAQGLELSGSPFLSTFHALGVHILRNHAEAAGLPRHFTILDRADTIKRIKLACKSAGVDIKQWNPNALQGKISRLKGDGIRSDEYAVAEKGGYFDEIVAEVWPHYERILKDEGSLDFDDLLERPVRLLKENEDIRRQFHNRWKYIHIDEYQDTNKIQYDFARYLTGEGNNICVVGDADQTIYTWRGADIQNILDFEKDFAGCTTILLEQNYRSTQTILSAANDVIRHNTLRKEKRLFTENSEGESITLNATFDENEEAQAVCEFVDEQIRAGVEPQEIAVLYRTNFQSRALEQAFLDNSIPYQLLGTRFFERREIKDTLSYIRAALNPRSFADIERIINVPRRGIGAKTLERIRDGKENELSSAMQKKVYEFFDLLKKMRTHIETLPASEALKKVVELSGMRDMYQDKDDDERDRIQNIEELVTLALKYDAEGPLAGMEHLLEDAALATDQDELSREQNAVRLMTVHASKGLEFDVVCITGLEEGLFPQQRESATRNEVEEERRLFYVALTRARKKVALFYAGARTVYGSRSFTIPSSFLSDISPDHLKRNDQSHDWYESDENEVGLLDLDEL